MATSSKGNKKFEIINNLWIKYLDAKSENYKFQIREGETFAVKN